MNKLISVEEAMKFINDGTTLMVGGFMGNGTPNILIEGVAKKGVKNLTVMCNDGAVPGVGTGLLVRNRQVKKLYATHIGLNPEVGQLMNSGEMEVELIPQGTFAERIRIGGAGIGGFLTPTGIGTSVEEGKQKMTVNGKEYILELPLHADVALIRGSIVDKLGNVFYRGTTNNFNQLMATAADIVIVAAEKIVEPGEIDPHMVMTPSLFVDYIVGGEV
jgi:acetate CoA/acetoacetate CoA-transferase alpha subunit